MRTRPRSEKAIRADIVKALRRAGYLVLIMHEDAYSGRGRSDLIVCARGRFHALEVKKPGGKPTLPQLLFQQDVWRAGGIADIVHSVEEAFLAFGDEMLDPIDLSEFGDEDNPNNETVEARGKVLARPHRTNGVHVEDHPYSPTGDAVERIERSARAAEAAARQALDAAKQAVDAALQITQQVELLMVMLGDLPDPHPDPTDPGPMPEPAEPKPKDPDPEPAAARQLTFDDILAEAEAKADAWDVTPGRVDWTPLDTPEPKRRGRPKGSKNKPKV